MECARAREAISAAIDGEADGSPLASRRVETHLRQCPACRAFKVRALELQGALRVGAAAPAAETRLVDEVVRRHEVIIDRSVRLALLTLAVAQLSLAVPDLLFGNDEGAPIHIAHEVGSWDVALAVGFIFAAWRPLRAVGMLPFVATLSFLLVLTAGIDLAHGHAEALFETTHLLEVAGSVLLWYLAYPIRAPLVSRRRGNRSGPANDPC